MGQLLVGRDSELSVLQEAVAQAGAGHGSLVLLAGDAGVGKTVLLHCVRAEMRTPAVAARYAVLRGVPVEDALRNVREVLPNSRSRGALHEAVRALGDAS